MTVVTDLLDTSQSSGSLPSASLNTDSVSWKPPVAAPGAPVTGYLVGVRSLTAAGSVVGVYPMQAQIIAAPATSLPLSAIAGLTKADKYAAAVLAISGRIRGPWS